MNATNNQLLVLSELLVDALPRLIEEFDLSIIQSRNFYFGRCPIHQGDNLNALLLYPDGYSVKGYWRCNTKHCEKKYKSTIIGFIRGLLSVRHNVELYSFNETINWICKFLGVTLNNLKVDNVLMDQKKFDALVQKISTNNNGVWGVPSKKKFFGKMSETHYQYHLNTMFQEISLVKC